MSARFGAVGPSPDDPSAVLFADEAAVHQLISQLRRLDRGAWTVDLTDPLDDGPTLRCLAVRATHTPLHIRVYDNTLHIDGAPAHLRILADRLALYAEHNDLDEPGMHCHIDARDPQDDRWTAPPARHSLSLVGSPTCKWPCRRRSTHVPGGRLRGSCQSRRYRS